MMMIAESYADALAMYFPHKLGISSLRYNELAIILNSYFVATSGPVEFFEKLADHVERLHLNDTEQLAYGFMIALMLIKQGDSVYWGEKLAKRLGVDHAKLLEDAKKWSQQCPGL